MEPDHINAQVSAQIDLLSFLRGIQKFTRHEELWEAVARLIRRLLDSAGGGLMLLDRPKEQFYFPAVSAEARELEAVIREERFPAGPDPFALLFPEQAACLIHDAPAVRKMFPHMDAGILNLIYNRLDVPLRVEDRVVGTLWAINRAKGPYDVRSAELMEALAGVTGEIMYRLGSGIQPTSGYPWAKTRMLEDLSHTIKTPLAVSMASLKLLEKHLRRLPDAAWQEIYGRAERNLERLLMIEYAMEDLFRQDLWPGSSAERQKEVLPTPGPSFHREKDS